MAKESSPSESPFDLEKLRALVELMEKHDLSVVTLRSGSEKWHLRRGAPEVVMPNIAAPSTVHTISGGVAHTVPSETAPSASGSSSGGSDSVSDGLVEIKSPTVGTFYAAPSPDDPPYVKVGSKVEPDAVVCLVEAMKVFNQIPAEVNGTIVEILAKDGDAVEFGQPMFKVRPN